MPKKIMDEAVLKNVTVRDDFWTPIQTLVTDVVVPYQEATLRDEVPGVEKSHAIENFRIAAGEAEGEFYGMVFQDSDVAKWLEAVAYSLTVKPDPELEKRADEVIALIDRAQEADGYLNTFFTVKEPQHKWQNLQECHELYCSGHMIEAAVAYKEATGKDALLDIMRKNADLICARFGKNGVRGYPGHQEIELALLRLHRLTGEARYLDTARYFLDERGTEPEYIQQEARDRGWVHFGMDPEDKAYAQVHAPVRQQSKAAGHAVRAVYMYIAMADLAAQTGDAELADACERLWQNITGRQMYITGGIGASVHGEAFSKDYELPNDLVYAETCASVAMVMFAQRMLQLKARGCYADIMEKELYNGILSGMQMDGRHFFYVNPLEVVPGVSGQLPEYRHVKPERPGWYPCSCCPPNVARLLMSLGRYAWGSAEGGIYAHTYLGGAASFDTAGGLDIECESAYPWEGRVSYTLHPRQGDAEFFFALHIPGWCKQWRLRINGETADAAPKDGYVYLRRRWTSGDKVELELELEPRRVYANTRVRADAGCTALQRGPVVYCFEETDNGENLSALRLPRASALRAETREDATLGKLVVLRAKGRRATMEDHLYSDAPPRTETADLMAIPYYLWGNRGPGGMRVWLLEGEA